MLNQLCRRVAPLGAFVLLLSGTASAATGGVRIVVQEWTPTNPTVQNNAVVLDQPGLLGNAIDQGWAAARGPVCTALENKLGKPDLLASGVTLYNMDCKMAQTGTLTVTGFANTLLTLTYKLPGNMFKATATQPSIAGKYADPCAFLTYDLSATTSLHLDTLALDPFSVTVSNVSRPDSCNLAGDIAKFGATTFHFFGGPDYLARVQSALDQTQTISMGPLNRAVASVVTPIQSYSKNYAVRTNWIRNGNIYVVFAPKYVPAPLSVGIGGSILIPKGGRVSGTPDCSTFVVGGHVQTGPAPIYDPVALTTTDAPFATVGSGNGHGAAIDDGDHFGCAYTATQMPAAVPVTYTGSGIAGPPIGSRSAYHVGLIADGWSGKIALESFNQGKNFTIGTLPYAGDYTTQYVPVNRTIDVDNHPNYDGGDSRVNPAFSQTTNLQYLNPQPLPPIGADPNLLAGNRLFRDGDFAGAAAAFERSHLANATSAVALHNLALAHARLGMKSQAVSELRSAASLARASGDIATENAASKAIIIVGGAPR